MKKVILLCSMLASAVASYAQNGLEQIIVEKYYISTAEDTAANSTDGILPINSTTYRIYVDMKEGYKFQAAFGVPSHELRIATTTLFFNNENYGSTFPSFKKNQVKNNTVMLDSWLSAGAACEGNYGVLKSEDDGVANVVNSAGLLKNNNVLMGLPLTQQDGLLAGTPPTVGWVSVANEIAMFSDKNDGSNGPVFSITNASWYCQSGAQGPDTTNKVLIAQITTNGDFSFELNIQIGTPSGGVEQYVAKNPTGDEISIPSLIYFSPGVSTNTKKVIPNALVNVYPNPASDLLTIGIAGANGTNNSYYSIYDAKGCQVAHKSLGQILNNYHESVDVSNYTKGLYFIIVSLDGVITSKKFIRI